MSTSLVSRLVVAVLPAAFLFCAPSGRAQVSAFDWSFQYVPFQGFAEQLEDTLFVHGPNNSDFSPGPNIYALLTAVAPVDGHVTISAAFDNQDSDQGFDAPVAFVGDNIPLPQAGGFYPDGNYDFEFDVQAGQVFGFGVWSADAGFGAGVATFHDLVFTPATWIDAGHALDPRTFSTIAPPAGAPDFGATLGSLGDINGDGKPDFAVGAPGSDRVFVVSGVNGATLLELSGPGFGDVVSGAGDVNGDGTPDILLGLPDADVAAVDAGRVEVRSGVDGSLLFAVDGDAAGAHLGAAAAGVRDVNHDGFAEIIVGAPQSFPASGYALLLAGPGGAQLHRFDGSQPSFGDGVSGLGDADGDGTADVLVADPYLQQVHVFSGLTGNEIATATHSAFGSFKLSPSGDVNGDGRADFVWGSFETDVHNYGHVLVCSGATGARLAEIAGADPFDAVGGAVAAGDFDGDGVTDVAFRSEHSAGKVGRVRIASGASNFTLIHELRGGPTDAFGAALAGASQLDGDGATDLAVGAPGGLGLRLIHALDGHGEPRLSGTGDLSPDSPLTLTLDDARANAPAVLVVSLVRVDLPTKGGVLVPLPSLLLPLATSATGGAQVAATWPAGVPGPVTVWMQAWIVDADGPYGFSASNGLGGKQP